MKICSKKDKIASQICETKEARRKRQEARDLTRNLIFLIS